MKSTSSSFNQERSMPVAPFLAMIGVFTGLGLSAGIVSAQLHEPKEQTVPTSEYRLQDAEFVDEGQTPYYVLKPGYQLLLEGVEGGQHVKFITTVTDRTRKFFIPGKGWVSTRVLEEMEWTDNKPYETAVTFYAIDEKTNSVFDFGDEVYNYNEAGTEVKSNLGSWHAGEPDEDGLAWPGVIMPGIFFLGAKYYQQQADGYSLEIGHNWRMGQSVTTPAGTFHDCITIRETNAIEPGGGSVTYKTHCPGIGLVIEDALRLTAYGYDVFDTTTGMVKPGLQKQVPIARIATSGVPTPQKATRKITDAQAEEKALQVVKGTVDKVEQNIKSGKPSILVTVTTPNKEEWEIFIDAETGEVLGKEKQ
ncbi:MAG: PepSY domain-containing protein [Gammaproteobacteria bacterium]